ncbi:hypothetical protein AWC38_SpisGene16007 [Stylophora pistillata]|uniref:Helix-turn-helix domain-containing protein n=1 Tax=Stylophora pistillata TaxID=50429 RepID=A0A2B4RTL9_STYPI|nr:hypothetical protein AWC38_SpisGene16007 [Stylophora pistillata]
MNTRVESIEYIEETYSYIESRHYYKRYVDDTLAIMPGLDVAVSFLNVLNGLHPSIHFTMELSNNDSIPFIGTLITKNGNKLETQVYRKPTNTGLLLHFQSHTDLRYKKCLIKTMVHRAKELSSTHQAFVDECRHLKSMFHRLGYPSSLVNFIIDKCDYSSTPDTKTKSVETLRVSIPFKDQISVNIAKRQMRDLSSKIGIDVQPVYTKKVECRSNETEGTHKKESLTVLTATGKAPHSSVDCGETDRKKQGQTVPCEYIVYYI